MTKTTREQIDERKYAQVHYWLRKNYGKADCCENLLCKGESKKFEWALRLGLKYRKSRKSFIKLCKQCHTLMDMTEETRRKFKLMKPKRVKRSCKICGNILDAVPNQKFCPTCSPEEYRKKEKIWRERHKRYFQRYRREYAKKNPEKLKADMRKAYLRRKQNGKI